MTEKLNMKSLFMKLRDSVMPINNPFSFTTINELRMSSNQL